MRNWHHSKPCTVLGLCLASGVMALAGPVSKGQAETAVNRWLQTSPRPLKASLGAGVDQVLTHLDAQGHDLFHEVRLSGGGFVVVAADDLLEPVVAFSAEGSLDTSADGLLNKILRRDLGLRMKGVAGEAVEFLSLGGSGSAPVQVARRKWDLLQGTATPGLETTSVTTVDDMRVDPLVQSKWNQTTVGGLPAYNYYAPSNYPSGCVATAIGQLMRFHQFPTAGIGVHPFSVTVNKLTQNLSTRGGDGAGGAYLWSLMPLVPSSSISDPQRQAIGALLFDTALSVNMDFESDGSGAVTGKGSAALKSTFGYGNAVYGYNGGGDLTGHGLYEMIQPNLSAGYPVVLAIKGDGGHAIVCDGYGYNTGTLYHHLNLGWGGSSDAWYNLPDIGTNYNFNVVHGCLYNVFPSGTGEIVSGRILDGSGLPVAGVTVSNGTVTGTSNSHGVYALAHVTPGTQTITASKTGSAFSQSVRIMANSSADYGTVGNLLNVDLTQGSAVAPTVTVPPQDQEAKLGDTATFVAGGAGTGPLHFEWSKNGTIMGSDSPTCTTPAAVLADNQADVKVRVYNSVGSVQSPAAKLSAVYLYNGSFEKGNSGWTLYNPDVVLTTGSYDEVDPHGGAEWLCLGDWSASVTDFAVQDITLPANATAADLSFWIGIGNKGYASTTVATNTFKVKVLDATGANVLATLYSKDNTNALETSGKVVWKSSGTLSLLPYKGRTIKLRFEAYQPGGSETGTIFALDDISLQVTASSGAVVSPTAVTTVTGGQAAFKANLASYTSDNHVNWTGNGGSFAPAQTIADGQSATVFTGGTTAGSFTLTATPVETGLTAGTATVTLVDPASVNVTVAGGTTTLVGTPVTLTSAVSLLTDPSTTWTASNGTFSASNGTSATWSSNAAGTFTITATSAVATGRSGSAQVVVVDPAAIQLVLDRPAVTSLPGAAVAITATGDAGCGVTWAVTSPATHVDQGLTTTVTLPATLPLTTKVYTVTSAHALVPSKTATAAITVKGMDLNADSGLDPRDLLVLAKEWGNAVSSPANLKGSGSVDDTDLAALLSRM